jgi:pimeloyl-ACP methyl ester carboxylesterase
VADAAGVERFAVMGHSGGGPHALACAALLPDRVLAAVVVAGFAPLDAEGLHWFAGMEAGPIGVLRATLAGPETRARHDALFGPTRLPLTAADAAAVGADWGWITEIVGPARAEGHRGQLDDDLAYVAHWGFDPDTIAVPTLVVQGGQDRVVPRAHGEWLAAAIPGCSLWLSTDDGHISVLDQADEALAWLYRVTRP